MIPAPPTDDMALYVVGALALLLITVLGLVMRAIIKGDLVPKKTVEEMAARDRDRITAQAGALDSIPAAMTELTAAQKSLADSFDDLADAAQLQVRVADALHRQVEGTGDVQT